MTDTAPSTRTRSSSGSRTRTRTTARAKATKAPAKRTPRAAGTRTDPMARFKEEALDGASTGIMMADRDLTIVYLNDAARELMRRAEPEFREIWPDFSADDLIGQCVDRFHRNPRHQRELLSDPDNLPLTSDIRVGGQFFGLTVTAQIDDDGEYVGCTLEWEDLTELLDASSKLAAIDRGQGVAEFTLDGTLITANDQYLEAVGYGLDELRGENHDILCGPDTDSRQSRELWTALAAGERREGEVRRRTRDGATVWLRSSYNPVFDRNGKPMKVIQFASDITGNKAAEATAKFRAEALDKVRTAVMMVDRDLVLYYMNDAARELMKGAQEAFRTIWPTFDADKLIGQCIDQFHANPDHQRRLLADPSNLPYRTDIEVLGMSFGLAVEAQIDPDGNYVGCTLEWEDLTELLNASAKLAAVDATNATIEFALDGTVITANENFLQAMGYGLGEITGQHHRMFVEPSFAADPAYRSFWDQLHRGEAVQGEFKRVTRSGETIWLQASYIPVKDRNGKPVKFFKLATDITEEKRFREQIENIVHSASDVMGAVAQGDLTRAINGHFDGDLALLQQATNASVENLAGLVNQIRGSAASMSASAREVAAANQDLSRRTEAQASFLEETASSMEEMTATVQQNADNARKASQLAASAREQAADGGDVVDKAVGAMREISESSKKIADIIGVIDEIAFQTNLLALNAAVEAARAGDQGRGFAVVASEVRNLAQRSAGAAKEIKSLINDSLEKVEDGSELVNRSGTQLGEIVSSVKKVSDIIAEIAAASEEQSAGINEVNQAVAEMDQGTQQNAAMVEQAAASSESVQLQSNSLLSLTQRFRTGEGAGSQGGAPQQAPQGGYQQAPPVYQQAPQGGYQQAPPAYQQGPPPAYQQAPQGGYQQGQPPAQHSQPPAQHGQPPAYQQAPPAYQQPPQAGHPQPGAGQQGPPAQAPADQHLVEDDDVWQEF